MLSIEANILGFTSFAFDTREFHSSEDFASLSSCICSLACELGLSTVNHVSNPRSLTGTCGSVSLEKLQPPLVLAGAFVTFAGALNCVTGLAIVGAVSEEANDAVGLCKVLAIGVFYVMLYYCQSNGTQLVQYQGVLVGGVGVVVPFAASLAALSRAAVALSASACEFRVQGFCTSQAIVIGSLRIFQVAVSVYWSYQTFQI